MRFLPPSVAPALALLRSDSVRATNPSVILFICSGLLLHACSQPSDRQPGEEQPAAEEKLAVEPAPPAPPGFQPIVYDEFADLIEPGLGCSFETEDGRMLMVASAPDDTAAVPVAAIKPGPVVKLRGGEAGGYARLSEGMAFTGGGLTVTIVRAEAGGVEAFIETTVWPAVMEVAGPGGTRVYPNGTYSCGA